MSEIDNPFAFWEEDIITEKNDIISEKKRMIQINDIIDLAQILQLGLLDERPDRQLDMGIEALKLLDGQPNPLKYNDYILRSERAYLTIHEDHETNEAVALKYGGMQLVGRIGHYTLNRFEEQWILALQMFEPKQLAVDSDADRIFSRLPAPLMLPVTHIRPPFIPYK